MESMGLQQKWNREGFLVKGEAEMCAGILTPTCYSAFEGEERLQITRQITGRRGRAEIKEWRKITKYYAQFVGTQ